MKSLSLAWRSDNRDDEEWLLLQNLSEIGRTPRPDPIEPAPNWWQRAKARFSSKPE